jgi:hypothetical protein
MLDISEKLKVKSNRRSLMSLRLVVVVYVLLSLVLLVRAQLTLNWLPCTTFATNNRNCQAPETNPPLSSNTLCTLTNVKYINDDPLSFNITYFVKKYRAQSDRLGSIIVIGDSFVVSLVLSVN